MPFLYWKPGAGHSMQMSREEGPPPLTCWLRFFLMQPRSQWVTWAHCLLLFNYLAPRTSKSFSAKLISKAPCLPVSPACLNGSTIIWFINCYSQFWTWILREFESPAKSVSDIRGQEASAEFTFCSLRLTAFIISVLGKKDELPEIHHLRSHLAQLQSTSK